MRMHVRIGVMRLSLHPCHLSHMVMELHRSLEQQFLMFGIQLPHSERLLVHPMLLSPRLLSQITTVVLLARLSQLKLI